MNQKQLDAVNYIKNTWPPEKRLRLCHTFMYEAIRHADRNMDICDDGGTCCHQHPERYDGELLALAPSHIGTLLSIIDRLQKRFEYVDAHPSGIAAASSTLNVRAAVDSPTPTTTQP